MNEQEVENMSTAIDLFTHIKIHLFKNSSLFTMERYLLLSIKKIFLIQLHLLVYLMMSFNFS